MEEVKLFEDELYRGYLKYQVSGGGNSVEIYTIKIVDSMRKQGYGTKLMNKFLKEVKKKGILSVYCFVDKENSYARHFYSAVGFEEVKFYGDFFGNHIMYIKKL